MSTFVLVHGSRHGGWCWQRAARLLRAQGHEVSCPTLTGNGERGHLLLDQLSIDLDTHVEDVAAHLYFEDLTSVVLVGHSYAGMVITGVAERSAERLERLVYLDALVPLDGEAHLDLAGRLAPSLRAAIAVDGRGTRLPASRASPAAYGVTDPADAAWMAERLTDQAAGTYQQPLASTGAARRLPRTFVRCLRSQMIAPEIIERANADPGISCVEIDAEHDVMITDPHLTAATLAALAGG